MKNPHTLSLHQIDHTPDSRHGRKRWCSSTKVKRRNGFGVGGVVTWHHGGIDKREHTEESLMRDGSGEFGDKHVRELLLLIREKRLREEKKRTKEREIL